MNRLLQNYWHNCLNFVVKESDPSLCHIAYESIYFLPSKSTDHSSFALLGMRYLFINSFETMYLRDEKSWLFFFFLTKTTTGRTTIHSSTTCIPYVHNSGLILLKHHGKLLVCKTTWTWGSFKTAESRSFLASFITSKPPLIILKI